MTVEERYARRELRLTKMLKLLHNIHLDKEHVFDMDVWVRRDHKVTAQPGLPPEVSVECRTSACAVGYAMLDPWFQYQGLRTSTCAFTSGVYLLRPEYDGQDTLHAAAHFFDLDEWHVRFLFDPETYQEDLGMDEQITPAMVADRVKDALGMKIPLHVAQGRGTSKWFNVCDGVQC